MNQHVTTIVGTLLITGGLYAATGPVVALAGLTTGVALATLPAPLGVGYAQLVVAAFAPPSLWTPALWVAEIGVLTGFAGQFPALRRGLAASVGVALGGVLWLGWVWPTTPPLVAAGTLLLVVALASYGLHRYERVRLRLVHQ